MDAAQFLEEEDEENTLISSLRNSAKDMVLVGGDWLTVRLVFVLKFLYGLFRLHFGLNLSSVQGGADMCPEK